METNEITIRINLELREFEVRGDAKYIEQRFWPYIAEYLEVIKSSSKTNNNESLKQTERQESVNTTSVSDFPDSFGEYLNRFPKGLSNVDKLLIASYYVQSKNENK